MQTQIMPLPLPGIDALMPAKPAPATETKGPEPKTAQMPAAPSESASPPPAQGTTSNVNVPVGALDVTADGTLEWLRQQQVYVARGNASATRNDTTVKADVLAAHYTVPPGKKDGVEITQVTADGNVHMIAPTAQAWGDHGVYDLAQHVVVLTGKALRLITTEDNITARDSLEYYEDTSIGVARGDAVAIRGDDKLTADVIAAKFVKTDSNAPDAKDGQAAPAAKAKAPSPAPAPATTAENGTPAADGDKKQKLEELDAKGHVVLVTITDVVTGDEGVYNPITDEATVTGNVKVTRGENQLDGARAEVDMATGISRVYAAPGTRVRGLFVQQKKDKAAPSAKTADASAAQANP
jgi:lipopolysaccharide export system protein LptA